MHVCVCVCVFLQVLMSFIMMKVADKYRALVVLRVILCTEVGLSAVASATILSMFWRRDNEAQAYLWPANQLPLCVYSCHGSHTS